MKTKLKKSVLFVLVAVVALVLPTACDDDNEIDGGIMSGAVSMRNEAGEWELITKGRIKMPRDNNYMVIYLKSEGIRPGGITVQKGSPNLSVELMDTIPDDVLCAMKLEHYGERIHTQRVKITALTPWEKERSVKFRITTIMSYNGWYSDFTLTQK